MSIWPQLTKAALLGTRREAVPTINHQSPLHQLLAQVPTDSPQLQLLTMAGILTLYEANGRLPETQVRPPERPLLPETQAVPPPLLQTHLATLLDGQYTSLLPQFLAQLATANLRLPPMLLPNLLDKATKSATIRPYLLPVLGNHGRWLASQNPAWGYASYEVDTFDGLMRQWRQSDTVKKQALLNQLRLTHPERGRQLLQSNWKTDAELDRNRFIKLLETNLSMADEPFLEAALDDRNHLVRRRAAELLAYLPESRLCQRMQRQVGHLLLWAEDAIVVRFPKVINPALVRDGVVQDDGKMRDKSRLRTRQLGQLITPIPLSHWTETWQKSPTQILQAAEKSKWPRSLYTAFSTAAFKQANTAWIEAILHHYQFQPQTGRLISVLPPQVLFPLILANRPLFETDQRPLTHSHPTLSLLRSWPHPWDAELSLFWFEQLATHIRQDSDRAPNANTRMMLYRLARQCQPDSAPAAADLLQAAASQQAMWQTAVAATIKTVQLRQQIQADFAQAIATNEK